MKTGAFLRPGRRRGGAFWGACLIVGMALAICAVVSGCSSQPAKSARASAPPPAIPVGVAAVKQGDFNVYITGLGSVQAFNTVSIKTRIDGQIMQVNFREGQDVRAGELLLVVDPRPYQVALDQAKANLAKDEAQLTNAKAQYERNKVLYQQGVIAKQDLDTLEASFGTYEGTIAADKAAIENAQLNLTYCYIKSPVDGRVGLRQVDPGNYVTAAGGTPMLVVTQLHPISLVFTIPEDQLQDVAKRMNKGGPLEVDAYSRDDQQKLATGTLLTINNQIDQTTGTVQLKATFANADNALWPNQFVNAHLLLETRKDAITAPASAIQRGPEGSFMYVVDSNNTVQMRPVQIALTQGNTVVIASGLQSGERVVTDGQEKLQAGMRVAPQAPARQRSGQTSGNIGSQT
ncbi:MAG TPA: MdtA/MuxA family multidrug efflux RND transporter periplasmic adaptor subunit [Candidatus Binatia bacterium]|nr:MdtA/MuxA family multidrug efflux RND transporter periplasmic adaptor subunit [Candidatus Binatia bacterium]